jgi:CHAT domain-containing protein
MKNRFWVIIIITITLIWSGFISGSDIQASEKSSGKYLLTASDTVSNYPIENIRELNESLTKLLQQGDYNQSKLIVDQVYRRIKDNNLDSLTLSDSYYLIGVFYSYTRHLEKAIDYLNLSILIREKLHLKDIRYARALYNLGLFYSRLGDFNKQEFYSLKSLEVQKKINGSKSPLLIDSYSSLVAAYVYLEEYNKAINISNIALAICDIIHDSVSPLEITNLYNNMGVCYTRLSDYSKANIYFEKSESIYLKNHLENTENYINLMNNLAISYGALNQNEKSKEYYERGVVPAMSSNSSDAYNIINSYSIVLGNAGKQRKGEILLSGVVDRAKAKYGSDSRDYIVVLNNYADFLREYRIDNKKSLESYINCLKYIGNNMQDIDLRNSIYTGYSLSLAEEGESIKALEVIQSLLFPETQNSNMSGIYDNPLIETIKPDRRSLKILRAKYKILWDIYRKSSDKKTLEAASGTAELIVSLLEKVRINISEEDSRLVLGDKFRDSYLNAIRDFNLLYTKTGNAKFLEKAFEYSERSKVAGLLASTRELKASQFHIPQVVADLERNLQRDISHLNARINEESVYEVHDSILISQLKENLLETTRKRDSLILVFEKNYPDYYAIKYNTRVAELNEIPAIIGRNGNYLNYVVSDSLLYIFIANRKHHQLLSLHVDSAFYKNIKQFRSLLSLPSPSENARSAFDTYQLVGNELYKTLIAPVMPYLISNKLLISPDNIISYVPFETLPTTIIQRERIMYGDLAYLMNDFDISYTYSATFMAESKDRVYSNSNRLIAFAPAYHNPIDIQSVLMSRQGSMGVLNDLPFARQEAEFVSDIAGGKLYLNDEASESVYKSESGKFDIIHLAMHTILNDKDPMHSTLIFSTNKDSIDDGYLKTYEVYGIPLKAKMVVLSSCNTGSGFLYSGEGILSLARGFIYSGSQSVVMSMWEIEDRSGTEIVEMFYQNLKKGYSKSAALKKARIKYLKNSDQLRSHPYFWSSLVVYGNDTPLYYSKSLIIGSILILLFLGVGIIYYFSHRRYS